MLHVVICILTESSTLIEHLPVRCQLRTTLSVFLYQFPSSSKVSLMPFSLKQLKVRQKESSETTRAGCNASNFLLSWSLNACALSLPLHRRINSLFYLPVPPPSRSLIHLISSLWLVQSPPPFSAGSSSVRLVLLAAPYSGAVVSPVESDCAGGREVNWKKLRCSHRGAEARGNKLDISPIHVGWRVYIYPPSPSPLLKTHIHSHTASLWSATDGGTWHYCIITHSCKFTRADALVHSLWQNTDCVFKRHFCTFCLVTFQHVPTALLARPVE